MAAIHDIAPAETWSATQQDLAVMLVNGSTDAA